ncbi:MAG: hypothetical protein WD768_02640 [Phycisphaeraceae bacterium]
MLFRLAFAICMMPAFTAHGADAPKPRTTLSDKALRYTVPDKPYAILKRGDIEAIIVNNEAVNDDVLKDHRAGYSGVAALRHVKRNENLFVPGIAGLNFEHILDGTAHEDRKTQFEPRNWPMELRVIEGADGKPVHAVELHQKPTFHHALESCQRYELLDDGTIQLTIEVIPRKKTFKNGYICLFWASYIHQPESLDIHFQGWRREGLEGKRFVPPSQWVRAVTPAHGKLSTHPHVLDARTFKHDEPFPLTLVYNLSEHVYDQPWYFGVSHGMAFVQMFRPQDRVRITQSPSGGGKGNPAWDFQFYIENYEVDKLYQFVMRAAYLPYESAEQVDKATRGHRKALGQQ